MKNFLAKYKIKKSENIIVACSWWSDSMFLIHELVKVKNKKSLIITHFNHNLRAKESNRDEKFVVDYCKKNWFFCEVWKGNIKKLSKEKKIWIEETARLFRYEFLKKVKEKYNARFIFTAHHLDDKIETFVFNLIRWSKLTGLISIEEKNGDILRPLLKISKNKILEECKKNNISYIEDSSNKSDKVLRNYIRIHIIPHFSKINSNYQIAFNRLMDYFWELKSYFDLEIEKILINNSFEIKIFSNFPEFMQKECIRYIYEKANSWTIGLSEWNITEIIRFINDKWNHTIKEIKKMKLKKINGKVYIYE